MRPRRPVTSLLLFALCVGVSVATAAPGQEGEGDSRRIFLPLGLKGVRMDELPVAPSQRPPTATRTASATPADTATLPPSTSSIVGTATGNNRE